MDEKVTPIHIRFHTDRQMESLTLSFLDKCRRFQAAFISCAVKEFAEKYQLFDLNEKELKKFIQAYLEYAAGDKSRDEDTLRLQKSLQLIGAVNVPPATTVHQSEHAQDIEPVKHDITSADKPTVNVAQPIEKAEVNEPVKEEKLVKDSDREAMQNVLNMFRGS